MQILQGIFRKTHVWPYDLYKLSCIHPDYDATGVADMVGLMRRVVGVEVVVVLA